ncbi:MAG TPA: hypothetical protein VFA69_02705, partial [Candidatus Nitrosotalea sp.]|nr:hypothetical protein [Candidatus Nitrosotalea sp.]
EQNMSNAHSLALFSALPCPFQPKIKSYTFEPMSSKATYDCDSLFSCTGPVDMKTHFELTGFVTGDNPHHPFDIGTYTLVVGDQWGDIVIQHFSEEYVIAYDKNPVNENKNGTTSNMPKVTGFGIHSFGGSIKLGSDDSFNETEYYTGNVGNIIAGLPVHVSISNPYDMFTHEYDVSSSSIMPDGSFNFTHTFLGKFGQDTYTLDFTYGAQKYELRFIPVVPP